MLSRYSKKLSRTARLASIKTNYLIYRHANAALFALGGIALLAGLSGVATAADDITVEITFDDEDIRIAVCQLVKFQEGAFGALIMVVSGIGAIVSSAFGAYRAATSMIVVASGSWILRSMVTLFFGSELFANCASGTFTRAPIDA